MGLPGALIRQNRPIPTYYLEQGKVIQQAVA